MDIIAIDGKFMVSMGFCRFEYKWNEDKTLSVWGKEDGAAHITTNSGTFIEAIDETNKVVLKGGDGKWFYVPVSKKPIRLRFKKLSDPKLTKAQVEKARQKVTRYLISDTPYGLNIPSTLPGAIGWMQKQLKAIPKQCQKAACFEFVATMKHGETYPKIEITYVEPESDAEVVTRVKIERERTRIAEACERAKLENLKAKYETAD